MVNPELVDWIKSQYSKGYSYKEIETYLLDQGYNQTVVNEAINSAINKTEEVNSQKNFLPVIILAVAAIILVIGGAVAFPHILGSDKTPQETCADKGGTICSPNQICEANVVNTSNTDSCCLGNCKEKVKEIKDCGTTDILAGEKPPLNQRNFNNDSTFVCLGESLLKNCEKSKATFKTSDYGDLKVKVEKPREGKDQCRLRLEYGSKEQIQMEAQKKYANKALECPAWKIIKSMSPSTKEKPPLSQAGSYTFAGYFSMGLASADPDKAGEMGCNGSLLEATTKKRQSVVRTRFPLNESIKNKGDYYTVGDSASIKAYDVSKTRLEEMSKAEKENHFLSEFQSYLFVLDYNQSSLPVKESELRLCRWDKEKKEWKKVSNNDPAEVVDRFEIVVSKSGKYVACYPKNLNQDDTDQGCGSVDYRGQTYQTVKIGDQCWLAENLNVGSMIKSSKEQKDNDVIEKYCYNDEQSNCDTYGGLYQWDEAMQYSTTKAAQGICPDGWHIPTDKEWYTLENYLAEEGNSCNKTRTLVAGSPPDVWCAPAGAKMASNESLWEDGALDSSEFFDSSGLNILPDEEGTSAQFWTSTYSNKSVAWSDTSFAWIRKFSFVRSGVIRDDQPRTRDYSVRCIKD